MVTLVAPTGYGKTRIVRELYCRLAAEQADPPYWPRHLTPPPAGPEDRFSDRKVVSPPQPFSAAASAKPSFLWLAAAVPEPVSGVPMPTIAALRDQVVTHLQPLVRRLERRRLLGAQIVRLVRALAPIPDVIGTVEELAWFTIDGAQELRRWRAERAASGRVVDVGELDDSRGEELDRLLQAVLLADPDDPLPAVIVLDDAHNIDPGLVGLLTDLIGGDLPVLIVATTWPEFLDPAVDPSSGQLREFLTTVAAAGRSSIIQVPPLSIEDLAEYIDQLFPGSDPRVARALGERAQHNPYALELLLGHRALRTARSPDGRLIVDPWSIAELQADLDALLLEHWRRLPSDRRLVLEAAALLGPRFLVSAVTAGLARIDPIGVLEPDEPTWTRTVAGLGDMAEFVERLRYDVAHDAARRELDDTERREVLAAAAEVVGHAWASSEPGSRRDALANLLVELARREVPVDLLAAARAAEELVEVVRADGLPGDGLPLAELSAKWFEAGGASLEDLVRIRITVTVLRRAGGTRLRTLAEATEIAELAERALGPSHELTLMAWLSVVRSCRVRSRPEVLAEGRRVLGVTRALIDRLPEPSTELRRDAMTCTYGFVATDQGSPLAVEPARQALAFCEQHYGRLHRHTLAVLSDLGYYLTRVDPAAGVLVRREHVARRVERYGSRRHPRVAAPIGDLVFSLLELGDETVLDEALTLIDEALDIRRRTFGWDSRQARVVRLNRTRVLVRMGRRQEAVGDPRGRELLDTALSETSAILTVRLEGRAAPGSRAIAHQRHGEALLATGQVVPAIEHLEAALELRLHRQRASPDGFAVRSCARSLVEALEADGQHERAWVLEAAHLGRSGEDGEPATDEE